MKYKTNISCFDKTFSVKDGLRLGKHSHCGRFKLFPFIANNNYEPLLELDRVVGRYICQIEGKKTTSITVDSLTEALKHKLEIEGSEEEECFRQVISSMFFDENMQIRPISLKIIELIQCEETGSQRTADYLVDVLGEARKMRTYLEHALKQSNAQSNVLEKLVASEIVSTPDQRDHNIRYQRITNAIHGKFESDFEFVLGARNRVRDYLIPLLEFYYFIYTVQTIMQLNKFLDGERYKCIPLYFGLDWEKTSQSRLCYTDGWGILQPKLKQIFAHAVVLEILNQTDEDCEIVDYIRLGEISKYSKDEDHRIAEEIKALTDRYRSLVSDCREMNELKRVENPNWETEAEVSFLFNSVRTQFENTPRARAYNAYTDTFEAFSQKYLKRRGRSGMMLNLTEELVIFLTKISVKDQERMRLNDVFKEFESRGVFLDNISKEQLMLFYEKLNLIEKKSDSGDAQYVKRIL